MKENNERERIVRAQDVLRIFFFFTPGGVSYLSSKRHHIAGRTVKNMERQGKRHGSNQSRASRIRVECLCRSWKRVVCNLCPPPPHHQRTFIAASVPTAPEWALPSPGPLSDPPGQSAFSQRAPRSSRVSARQRIAGSLNWDAALRRATGIPGAVFPRWAAGGERDKVAQTGGKADLEETGRGTVPSTC